AFVMGLVSCLKEMFCVSPRRVLALAGLTLKEALRRKALMVFVVFAVLLMFGGWFLANANSRQDLQVRVHITFMLTTISWLILPVVIFLSCWGIPEDIRVRSLHTVVTKPVRRAEIVMGRMLGFMAMSTAVLLLMGIVGYIWIQRQIPAEMKTGANNLLTCRVPSYGNLFFLDRDGLPKTSGINVGDPWMYRSFIEGNSRARAVWLFGGVTPGRLGDDLRLESRFEAFRTIKGSEESITGGLEAQYTLVRNLREDAFSGFGVGVGFRPAAEALREGNFVNAAELLEEAASRMVSSPGDFSPGDCQFVSIACRAQVDPVLKSMGAEFEDVTSAFRVFGEQAEKIKPVPGGETPGYEELSRACAALSETLRTRAADLLEAMPAVEVPLEPYRVSEYHEGDDYRTYPRTLTYAADYEGTARFLASTIADLNEQGKVAAGSELSPTLSDELAGSAGVSPINADLVAEVLQEELGNGTLTVSDGKLQTAGGERWLQFFDRLVREERLVSLDPEGWKLTVDLFEDLAKDGNLRVEVSCLNDQMYLGMARPDLFIRLKDNSFLTGYSKALLNIGLMLGLVIVLGVTASCVVKGPVSFFFTLTVFVIGQFFHQLMLRIVAGEEKGGGIVESAMLIFQHRNPNVGIDANEQTQQLVRSLDSGSIGVLKVASNVIPDFSVFSNAAAYIENGFDVPWSSSVLPSIALFFGFLIPCVLIGSACLKFRELEAK
ncbi:MAG: ABC transporter permease, partial [Planctomycetaceae bacterium]|nr:ABC transporter permease [Planctomycetaceae bacterium]